MNKLWINLKDWLRTNIGDMNADYELPDLQHRRRGREHADDALRLYLIDQIMNLNDVQTQKTIKYIDTLLEEELFNEFEPSNYREGL